MIAKGKQRKDVCPLPKPALSLRDTQSSWFILDNAPYSAAMCSTADFKRFARQHVPKGIKDPDTLALLRQSNLDTYDRWFVLCSLPKACKTLYSTQEEAEEAITATLAREQS